MMNDVKKLGRPKKREDDKVQYQRIAVYLEDYLILVAKVNKKRTKITDAFTEMVKKYE